MAYTNAEMEQMLKALGPHLDRVDLIGYTAARNTRILRDELREYFDSREKLVLKHGEEQVDGDGNPTGTVRVEFGTEAFSAYAEELSGFAAIEHEPALMKLKYEQAIGRLSGTELLELDWMFED